MASMLHKRNLEIVCDSITIFLILLYCRSTIRDKIIPHAVSWFTGEAAQDEYGDMEDDEDDLDEDDEEDEDEDDEEDEEDDDDEDEEEETKTKKKVN